MATVTQVSAARMDLGRGEFRITVDKQSYVQLNQLIKGIAKTDAMAHDPRLVAIMIPYLGQRLTRNHVGRGSLTTPWPPLSEETLRIKDERGYGGTRMMVQSGAMYQHGVYPFAAWTPTQFNYGAVIPPTPMQTTKGIESIAGLSGPTYVTATIRNGTFSATMSGPKAANQAGGAIQYRGGSRGWVNLPARPFWFVDQVGVEGGTVAMVNDFLSRWVADMPRPVGASGRAVMGLGSSGVTQVSTFGQGLDIPYGPSR